MKGLDVTTPNEEWRPIPGHEGHYEISNHGRVRSLDRVLTTAAGYQRRHTGKLLTPRTLPNGYLKIHLGGRHDEYIHRLVLMAFVGPCPQGMECLHSDGNPTNNHLLNLRWASPSDNAYDRVRHGTHNEATKTHCPRQHRLEAPNLRTPDPGRNSRRCLACHRAYSHVRRLGLTSADDLQKISDEKYIDIMAA